MDKRTLLFILCMAATFFFVNYYFTEQRDKQQSELVKQQQVQKAEQRTKDEASSASRIASVSSLPIAELYEDAEGTAFLANGVIDNGAVLVLAWAEDLPSTVYYKAHESQEPPTALQLISTPDAIGSPVLYASTSKSKIDAVKLSQEGTYDIQLIDSAPGNATPMIYLGEYKNGQFGLPFAGPKNIAIAVYQTAKGYLPMGIYNPTSRLFSSLETFPAISSNLAFEQPSAPKKAASSQKAKEEFYVLENEYVQLVFSNYGGALAEINLPFQSSKDKESVVREIEFDRTIKKDYSFNDHFPANPYYIPGKSPKGPFSLTEKTPVGGYYPLIRRSLVLSANGNVLPIPPRYYSMNIVSDYPETAELVYEVKKFDDKHIVFEAVQQMRRITKTFSLIEHPAKDLSSSIEAPYVFSLSIQVDGDSKGLSLTSGIPEVELMSGGPSPSLKYMINRKGKADVSQIDLPKEKETLTVTSLYPDWVSNSNGYLGIIIDPQSQIGAGYRVQYVSGTAAPTRLIEIDQQYERFKPADYPGYNLLLPLNSNGGQMQFRVFAGPYQDEILKSLDETFSDPITGTNPNYAASQSFHGWFSFISEPFAKFLFILLNFFHSLTNSWALSIILLTVALRVMLYPLNAWSFRSMKRMQMIAPEVAAIQAKYKKEPKKAQIEVMNLYREKKVNPFTGCFPILIQMPFLIGMFDLLKSTFALRGASFIPGWIDNLTAPDVLFSWSYPIFFIGTEFHLLPILLGLVMFLQQKMSSTTPKDKNLLTDQQKQQKMMGNIMVIVFSVMFYHFPSGLNIYWLSSMLLGILQQWFTNRQLEKAKGKLIVEK